MPLSVPYAIQNGTTADATEVDGNFTEIESYVNTELISRDGAVAMTGQLNLAGDPTADNHAARKAFVEAQVAAFMPKGAVVPYAGAAAPTGWLLCDGSAVSRTTYASLFAIVGTTYGAGDGSTTFLLPNLKGRVIVARDAAVTAFDTLGEAAGSRDAVVIDHTHAAGTHTHSVDHNHALVTSNGGGLHDHVTSAGGQFVVVVGNTQQTEVQHVQGTNRWTTTGQGSYGGFTDSEPDHTHPVDLPNFTGTSGPPSAATGGATGAVSATNANLQPYLVMNYIIRY